MIWKRIALVVLIVGLFVAGITTMSLIGEDQITSLQNNPMTPLLITTADLPAGYTLTTDRRDKPAPWELGCGNNLPAGEREAVRIFSQGIVNTHSVYVSVVVYPDPITVGRQIDTVRTVTSVCRYEHRRGSNTLITPAGLPTGAAAVEHHGVNGGPTVNVYAPAGVYLVIVSGDRGDNLVVQLAAKQAAKLLSLPSAP